MPLLLKTPCQFAFTVFWMSRASAVAIYTHMRAYYKLKALHMGLIKTPFCADLDEDFCQTRLLVPDNLRTGVSRACRYDPDLNPPTKSLLCTTTSESSG